ncbi:MAG: FKBP-type peptidyl-prolyl cis-trans isomerase [Bacteroidota bacterium]
MSTATNGQTVRIHYTGTLADGTQFDSSEGRTPLEFTLGSGQVIPGFDAAVAGMAVGATKTVVIPAAEAYGEPRPEMVIEVGHDQFPAGVVPEVGQELHLQTPEGQHVPVRVVEVGDDTVLLDANHPLAGEDLTFALELVEIV